MRCANNAALTSSPHLPSRPAPREHRVERKRRGYRVRMACAIIRAATATATGLQARTISKSPAPVQLFMQIPYIGTLALYRSRGTFWYHVTIVKRGCLYSIGKIPVVTELSISHRDWDDGSHSSHSFSLYSSASFLLSAPAAHHPSPIIYSIHIINPAIFFPFLIPTITPNPLVIHALVPSYRSWNFSVVHWTGGFLRWLHPRLSPSMENPPLKWIAALGSDVPATNEYSRNPNQ